MRVPFNVARRVPVSVGSRWSSRLFAGVLALAAGRPVFTADYYAVDSLSGKVSALIDWNDPTHTLAQGNGANQCALPAAHADFAGRLCLTFASAAPNHYLSNRSGVVNYMHDGTGGELFLTNTPTAGGTSVPAGSRNASGRGFSLVRLGGTPRADFYALTTANAFVIQVTGANPSWAVDVPTYIHAAYETASTPDATLRQRSTSIGTANQAIAPESGNSSQNLRLGTDGTNHASMRWRSLAFFPALTASQRALVQQYIQQDTGITP